MAGTYLYNAIIATSKAVFRGSVAFNGDTIEGVWDNDAMLDEMTGRGYSTRDLQGATVMAGGIDLHVHFREPGLTAKADMETESRAAVLGGITSFVDMPNTKPATTDRTSLSEKYALAQGRCHANFGFNIGATNSNTDELMCTDPESYGAVKVFMGSSTGNMLVDDTDALSRIFSIRNKAVMVHCEDESLVRKGLQEALERHPDGIIPFSEHCLIRSRKACWVSTMKALEMAMEKGTRLHVLHVSTSEEIEMIRAARIHNPHITAESSANYMTFCSKDYDRLGARIKCNPSIKEEKDREALIQAFADGLIDTIGSDHAPHLTEEKDRPYTECPSGIPSIAHQFPAMLTLCKERGIGLERLASAMSEKPAEIAGIKDRGRMEKGFKADIAVFREQPYQVPEKAPYKCGWSPYAGRTFAFMADSVYVNGVQVVRDGELLTDAGISGRRLVF